MGIWCVSLWVTSWGLLFIFFFREEPAHKHTGAYSGSPSIGSYGLPGSFQAWTVLSSSYRTCTWFSLWTTHLEMDSAALHCLVIVSIDDDDDVFTTSDHRDFSFSWLQMACPCQSPPSHDFEYEGLCPFQEVLSKSLLLAVSVSSTAFCFLC